MTTADKQLLWDVRRDGGLVAVLGSLVLAYAGKTVDGAAIAIGAGAVSALALMIAPGAKAGE